MHELGGIFPGPASTTTTCPPKPTWGGGVGSASDTLESIVHQATYCNNQQSPNLMPCSVAHQQSGHQKRENIGSSVVGSSGGKWAENSGHIQTTGGPPPTPPGLMKKRTRSESENCAVRNTTDHEMSACASANATFCKENNNTNDTTMMTWASYESPRSCTRTKITTDEDSACHGGSVLKSSKLRIPRIFLYAMKMMGIGNTPCRITKMNTTLKEKQVDPTQQEKEEQPLFIISLRG